MAVLQGKWLGQRGVSLKNGFYVRTWRGRLVICKWPRGKSGNIDPGTRQRMEDFKNAQLLAQYMIPQQQIVAREVSAGTALLPRDLLTAAMYGRLWAITMDDGRSLYSMAAANDVSQNLDIIAQLPGDMLARGVDGWERLAGAPGFIIVSNGPTEAPEFKAGLDGVRLEKTVGQNVTGGNYDPVTWNSALFDDNSFWDAGNSNRITVPVGVSRMSFTAGLRAATVATGATLVSIRDQGGVEVARSQDRGGSGAVATTVATGSIGVTPGDWYEVAFFTALFRAITADLRTFFAAEVTRAA